MNIRLPDAELDVLKILWQLGKATATEIRESQAPPRDHATVSTHLRRLVTKKLVRRKKSKTGREFVYEAIAKPEKTRQKLVQNFVQQAFDGSGIELVNALFQTTTPSADELEQLQQLLDDLKKTKRGTSR